MPVHVSTCMSYGFNSLTSCDQQVVYTGKIKEKQFKKNVTSKVQRIKRKSKLIKFALNFPVSGIQMYIKS
jgi:hypothetical protein